VVQPLHRRSTGWSYYWRKVRGWARYGTISTRTWLPAQALILMVGYLSMETVIATSARPLGADEPSLRERWREAAVDLVVPA